MSGNRYKQNTHTIFIIQYIIDVKVAVFWDVMPCGQKFIDVLEVLATSNTTSLTHNTYTYFLLLLIHYLPSGLERLKKVPTSDPRLFHSKHARDTMKH
jgi:hypothetical protein